MADILRQKTEAERLRIAGRTWKSARVILREAVRTELPDWNTDQVNLEIAWRISHGVKLLALQPILALATAGDVHLLAVLGDGAASHCVPCYILAILTARAADITSEPGKT